LPVLGDYNSLVESFSDDSIPDLIDDWLPPFQCKPDIRLTKDIYTHIYIYTYTSNIFSQFKRCFFLCQPWPKVSKHGITIHTPLKINMEPKDGGLEDDFPFQLGEFGGSMLLFRGVRFIDAVGFP